MIYSFLQNGDSAVTVQFKNEISEEVNRRVTGLCNRIEAKHINGIIELVPTFASLTVFYDCTIISSKKLKKKIKSLINGGECDVKSTAKVWNIPVSNLFTRNGVENFVGNPKRIVTRNSNNADTALSLSGTYCGNCIVIHKITKKKGRLKTAL